MQVLIGRYAKTIAVIALLIGLDLALSLPIMGATYRPFSWTTIAPADEATLYPVIQDISVGDRATTLRVRTASAAGSPEGEPAGEGRCVLQCSTNLSDPADWWDVCSTTVTDNVIQLIDTNPVSRAVFYRVRQIFGDTP